MSNNNRGAARGGRGGDRGGRGGGNNKSRELKKNPDEPKLQKAIEDAILEITTLKTELTGINTEINRKKRDNEFFENKGQRVSQKVHNIHEKIKKANQERIELINEIESTQKVRDSRFAEVKRIKDRLNFPVSKNVDENLTKIDEEIAKYERTISTTSMTLREEKEIVDKIKKLNESKNLVKNLEEMIIHARKASVTGLEKRKENKETYIQTLQDQIVREQESLNEVQEQPDGDVSDLEEKKVKLEEKLEGLKAKVSEKRDEKTKAQDIWYNNQREERQKEYEKKKAEREQMIKERNERYEARKKEENSRMPFEIERYECDDMVKYLNTLLPKSEQKNYLGDSENDNNSPSTIVSLNSNIEIRKVGDDNIPEGSFLKSKKDMNDFATGISKKSKKNRNRNTQNKGAAANNSQNQSKNNNNKSASKGSPLTHALTTYASFEKHQINVPSYQGDIKKAIQQLLQKKQDYLEKAEKIVEQRKKEEEEKEKAKEVESQDQVDQNEKEDSPKPEPDAEVEETKDEQEDEVKEEPVEETNQEETQVEEDKVEEDTQQEEEKEEEVKEQEEEAEQQSEE